MNKLFHQYHVGLLASFFVFLITSCTSNINDSNSKPITSQVNSITAPASLQGSALALDINKTELISGTEQRLFQDGTLKNYFYADRMFNDGRDYNGIAWGSEYKYSTNANHAEIVQLIKVPDNGATVEVTVKTQLTYLTADTGTFELDVNQHHSIAGSVHYSHAGTFHPIANTLDMMEKGLNHSNMDFIFQNISANQKNIELKAGSKITMVFSDPHSAKFTLNNKDYESKDYQLIAVDTFNKKIQGTLNGDTPFEINLHFDQFESNWRIYEFTLDSCS